MGGMLSPGQTPGPTGTTPPTVVDASGNNLGGNVGTVNGDSCVYIGNGWVLTAAHVPSGTTSFSGLNGQTFAYDGSNYARLTVPGTSTPVDLSMYRLTTNPVLPSMTLSNTSGVDLAKSGNAVTMCGYGRTVSPNSFSYYDTSQTTYTPTSTETAAHEGGYATTGTPMLCWGTNKLLLSQTGDADDGYGPTTSIVTRFNPNYGGYAQASFGDSGGAMFGKMADGSYALAGLMFAIGSDADAKLNQPSNDMAVFNLDSSDGYATADTDKNGTSTADSITFSADISVYMSEIDSIMAVPEPSTGWVAVLVVGALFGSYRRWTGARRT